MRYHGRYKIYEIVTLLSLAWYKCGPSQIREKFIIVNFKVYRTLVRKPSNLI